MLEGKAKADFEKWFYLLNERYFNSVDMFYKTTDSMQYGVYVDWFDSVGIDLEDQIERSLTGKKMYYACRISEYKRDSHLGNLLGCGRSKQRPEARTAAIKKANEIYNERFKDDKFLAC